MKVNQAAQEVAVRRLRFIYVKFNVIVTLENTKIYIYSTKCLKLELNSQPFPPLIWGFFFAELAG